MLDKILNDAAEAAAQPRYPAAYYSHDGDCVFFYNEGGEYIRSRVDRLLTVFRDPSDQRILGLQLKGIRRFPPHEGIGVEVSTGGRDDRGRRLDVVRVLLLSFRDEGARGAPDPERTNAYVEAMQALGCGTFEFELV
jgi:hypothetical protein